MIKPHGSDELNPLFVYDSEKRHAKPFVIFSTLLMVLALSWGLSARADVPLIG